MAPMEFAGHLSVGVVDIDHGIARGCGPPAVPGMIQEDNDPLATQRFSEDWSDWIAQIVLRTDINRSIVHVVLDALAKNVLQAKSIAGKLEVRTQINTPAGCAAAEVELILEQIIPFDLSQNAGHFDVSPLLAA